MTTIVVETGAIVANSNSYVSEAELTTFATARGITLTQDEDDLLVQAMDWLENLDFKGAKRTRDQSLQWPRVDVWIDGYYYSSETIPQQLKDGLCFAALAVDAGTDPMQDVERQVTMERVDSIEVQYTNASANKTISVKALHVLRKLMSGGVGRNNCVVGKA